jgi:hypothetical protein
MSSLLSRIAVSTILLVGLAGALVAWRGHGGQELLRLREAHSLTRAAATTLSAARVQEFVARAPEPVAAAIRTPVQRIRCTPRGGGPLRNPWGCEIRYRSGTHAHYDVMVRPNGYYMGRGTGRIEGCCIKAPTLQ